MNHHRTLFFVFTILALIGLTGPVGAQDVDPGNDSVDMNCNHFPERNAVEAYFAHDGGSADRNVDDLDPDGDGVPCNETPDDAPQENPVTDPLPSNDGVSDKGDGGSDTRVTRLPETGTGTGGGDGRATPLAIGTILAALAGGFIAGARRVISNGRIP